METAAVLFAVHERERKSPKSFGFRSLIRTFELPLESTRFKKEGWKVFGSSRTIEVLLSNHYAWLNGHPEVYEIIGTASGFKSKNLGRQMAMNNASVTYAAQMNATIKGHAVSDMKAQAGNPAEFDQFYGVFERSVEQELRGEMKESFSLIRDAGKGTFELQSFFLINDEAAMNARRRALKFAAKESIAAQKYADIVSKYIDEKNTPHRVLCRGC